MSHYDFFQNKECEYFPCHPGADPERFSCLFCYCPLYALGDDCGGCFTYNEKGIKDCSRCLRPHCRENYGSICKKLGEVLELVKKNHSTGEKP
ncbi:MAG: cysteine-rich small domain-containing protein [Candidatus Faecousia sp.]|nr:cysteine-rich small domain-containing protein [Candidatus Faecousia sp.]